ncbi:MAG: hypothetical protein V4596_02805 [Bdellovibrionota bacterium]
MKWLVVAITLLSSSAWAMDLKLNDLEISNRAQCALDSAKATKSTFLIMDGYNAGRLSHGLAKSMGKDANTLSSQGMKEFRLSVASLQNSIIQKLSSGELPLLPSNLSLSTLKYAQIANHCNSEVYCPELSAYLKSLWTASQDKNSKSRTQSFAKIDSFNETQFLKPGEIQNQCYILKKFSPLQSHLYGTDIGRAGLNNLAKALADNDVYVTNCSDTSDAIDSRSVAFQIEVLTESKRWDTVGFDFWNSVKIYLSWAWRNASEVKKTAPKFNLPFRNIDLEESLLFVSNGCKSLTAPQCDSENLSLNSLRELAKVKVQTEEFDKVLTSGPEAELLRKGARSVNNDFMALADYDKASDWVKNFSGNFQERQVLFKNRLLNAHQFYSILSSKFTAQDLVTSLRETKQFDGGTSALKNELYYLCSEWNLSSNEQFDFIRSDILRVTEIDNMLKQSSSVGRSIPEQVAYYKTVADQVGIFCGELEETGYFDFDEETLPNQKGYRPWAKEMLTPIQVTSEEGRAVIQYGEGATFLGTGDVVLCKTSPDCVRNVLKYAIDLLNVSKFSEGFLSSGHIQSSEMLNPYNELNACKVYDPWFAKKRTRKRLVADLVNTVAVGASGLPIYLDVDFTPNKVTSFKSMIENGEVRFDPNIEKGRMATSILADLGPLAGAPCAVQISPNSDKAFNFYTFGGITINACTIKSKRGLDYNTPKDAVKNAPTDRTFCTGCTLNFVGMTSTAAHYAGGVGPFNPLKFGAYLFRSMYRFFKGMKDPVNVPRSYNIDLNLLSNTYKQYNGIPSSCVDDIKKGKPCKENFCRARASMALEKETDKDVKSLVINKAGNSYVTKYKDKCGWNYELTFNCDQNQKTFEVISLEKNVRRKRSHCGATPLISGGSL